MRLSRMSTRMIPTIVAVAALLTGAVAFAITTTAGPSASMDVPTEIVTLRPLVTSQPEQPTTQTSDETSDTATVQSPSTTGDPAVQPPATAENPASADAETPPQIITPPAPEDIEIEDSYDDDEREVVAPPVREHDDDYDESYDEEED